MTAMTPIASTPKAAPFAIRAEKVSDVVAREALLDACFGANRHARTCQRLRNGRTPADSLALSAVARGKVVGTVRMWHVSAGGTRALVLGPLAVDDAFRKLGVGAALVTPRACGGKGTWQSRGSPAWRCRLLQPLRLLGRKGRRVGAARRLRAGTPARPRTGRRRARWRLGHDCADRRLAAQAEGSADAEVASSGDGRSLTHT